MSVKDFDEQQNEMEKAMLGNSTNDNSVPVSMPLGVTDKLRSLSVTANVGKFNLPEIVDKCRKEALKGRFEASIDVDYIEKDQRDLFRTLEHYGYAVTAAKELNEGQNTFYIKW